MRKRINVMIEEEAYERIKDYAKTDNRSAAKEMSLILELYKPGMIPGISIMVPGVTPTPAPTQQPLVYTPTTATTTTPTPTPDTSQMTKIEQAEYAKELLNQAEVVYAKELKQLEITKKENAELLKQLYAEEKQAQKQEARTQSKALTPEEEQLNQQKLELQKQKMQEKRDSLIRDKALELDLEDAEKYNEDWLLDAYFGMGEMVSANYNEEEKGIPNPYKNKSIDELYKYMNEIKQIEIKEREEETRRDALPHDIDDYDYKSEDFIQEVNRLQNVWVERGTADTTYDDEDYNILFNYYFRKGLYRDFEERMNHPDYAFSNEDMQELQNAFNRTDIDINYINSLMCGDGHYYRSSHNKKSYFEEHQEERAEWQRIIDEGKKKKEII